MKRLALFATAALTFAQPAYAYDKADEAARLLAIAYCMNIAGEQPRAVLVEAAAQVAMRNGIPVGMLSSDYVAQRAATLIEVIGCRRLLNR